MIDGFARVRWWMIRGFVAGGFIMATADGVDVDAQTNYDEAAVKPYTLPDPLRTAEGRGVTSPELWVKVRRPELLRLFETNVYGRTPTPPKPIAVAYEMVSEDREALGGKAVRREVSVRFGDGADAPRMEVLLYLPKDAAEGRRVPAFLGLNFEGNHAVSRDPGVRLSTAWMRADHGPGIVDHKATEAARGTVADRWCAERVVERGYALATVYYGDLDPDFDDGFHNGVHPLFYRPGQTKPAPDQWGAIGAWAWGLSRTLDYLGTVPEIDSAKVAVMGHSRLGKAALWAGAQDTRFALVVSNNSGEGGASLSRRNFGEDVAHLNKSFPHWFCDNYKPYSGREDKLPVDQHELIALIAPRPVLISSAEDDKWADPRGEFLAGQAADPVYRLLGTDGLLLHGWPSPAEDSLSKGTIGYRYRPGKHDVLPSDWEAFLNFADAHLKK
ncbi:glucuronyl esterase domain-containing protein [Paludisphaera mucosa]|uniref:Acetylxylan esterase n=1 Tax=Paludisphaera mucosa TaxID=3030827 RepID=A0ABT6FIF5_9BACT|nr:acetylxylan esterase [Paludisphaera mucosa]MDG3007366.1 acetylxylan esterase [Paludisphaera mucosa]